MSMGDGQAQERPLLLDHTLTIWSAKASFLLEISIKSPSFLEGGRGTPIAPRAPPHHQATCPSERGPPAGSWPGADPTNREAIWGTKDYPSTFLGGPGWKECGEPGPKGSWAPGELYLKIRHNPDCPGAEWDMAGMAASVSSRGWEMEEKAHS